MPRPRKAASATPPTSPKPTGLFVICPEVLNDPEHQDYLEVVECRNGRHTTFCPSCGGGRYFLGRNSKWRRNAVTLAVLKKGTKYRHVHVAGGAR